MIDKSLLFIRNELNGYLKLNTGSTDEKAALANIINQDGKTGIPDNTLGITLVNIEEERTNKAQIPSKIVKNDLATSINPEIRLNLYVLLTANFNKYDEALKIISLVVRFFQGRNYFDHQSYPALDPSIQRIMADLYTINFEQINQLWGALGAKYYPSVIYKLRMLTVLEGQVEEILPVIKEQRIHLKPQ